jgi:hypothetical protein
LFNLKFTFHWDLESEENMNNFKFESEFVEVNDQVLKIYCKSENNSFYCLIDTYGDPYMIYYPLNVLNEDEEESFRDQIFDYLEKKYPGYF